MIDTTIEIRSTDRKNLIFALERILSQLKENEDKERGSVTAHNYDAFYMIEAVKQIA